jgi:hypothetical protein
MRSPRRHPGPDRRDVALPFLSGRTRAGATIAPALPASRRRPHLSLAHAVDIDDAPDTRLGAFGQVRAQGLPYFLTNW